MGLPPSVSAARVVRSIAFLINLQSVGLCLLGCAAVAACERLQLSFALDISVVVFGVTFALTFTITQAYQRRERALTTLAELKASIIALYWHHRDWAQGPDYPASLGDGGAAWAHEFASVAVAYLSALQRYLAAADGYEGVAEVRLAAKRNATAHLLWGDAVLQHEVLGDTFIERVQRISSSLPGHACLMEAYSALSKISVLNEWLTHKAGYTRGGEGGMSRSAQYLRYLVAHMEQLRMIKIYRTPVTLRHACTVLVHVLTVLLAPYFRHAGRCDAGFPGPCPAPYIMACLWVLVTTLLLNVQASNEHPLDMTGIDDVFVELTEEFGDILENSAPKPVINGDARCFDAWRQQFAARWGS